LVCVRARRTWLHAAAFGRHYSATVYVELEQMKLLLPMAQVIPNL
jgi:hypothetical protein